MTADSELFLFEELADWGRLPAGWTFHEVVDVAVDAQDRVYVFTRGEHPLIIFEQDGSFVDSWGEGLFVRPHGVTIVEEGGAEVLYCVDDDGHWIGKFTLDGSLISQIGVRGQGAPACSGEPFNRPTKVAADPKSGDLYISDGYGNRGCTSTRRTASASTPGATMALCLASSTYRTACLRTAPARSTWPIAQNHRVQIFDADGIYLDQWPNMHRPCGLCIKNDVVYVGQLPSHLDVNASYPNIGACITVHDLSGRQFSARWRRACGHRPRSVHRAARHRRRFAWRHLRGRGILYRLGAAARAGP